MAGSSSYLLSVLGGDKVKGGEGMDYGYWSPQNFRAVVMAPNRFISVKHVRGKGSDKLIKYVPTNFSTMEDVEESFKDVVWKGFGSKKFGALEVILVDRNLFNFVFSDKSSNYFRNIYSNLITRLYGVFVADLTSEEAQSTFCQTLENGTVKEALESVGAQIAIPSEGPREEALTKFSLSPNFYHLDIKGGSLERHLYSQSLKTGGSGFKDFVPGSLARDFRKVRDTITEAMPSATTAKEVISGGYLSWMTARRPVKDFKMVWKSVYADQYEDHEAEYKILHSLGYVPKEGEEGVALSPSLHICLFSDELSSLLGKELGMYSGSRNMNDSIEGANR